MVKRQCQREIVTSRFKRGSEQRLACRDQAGLLPGQRGGAVIVSENVPVVVGLGCIGMLMYVDIPVTIVNYDYSIHDMLKNLRSHVGASAAGKIAAREAKAESEHRARADDLRYGFMDEFKSRNRILVPVKQG